MPGWTGSMSAAPAPRSTAAPVEPDAAELETRAGGPTAAIRLPDDRQRAKKVTSGSENRQRTKGILVRLHPTDIDRIRTDAAAAGMSAAGYLASGRLGAEAPPRPRVKRHGVNVDVAALTAALGAFHRQATNYNQAVRALNTLTLFAEEHGSDRLAEEVADLRSRIEQLQQEFRTPVAAIMGALAGDREG